MHAMRCIECDRRTTRLEAASRKFRTRACEHCGGYLIPVDWCGATHPRPTPTGYMLVCRLDAGHRGEHEATFRWLDPPLAPP